MWVTFKELEDPDREIQAGDKKTRIRETAILGQSITNKPEDLNEHLLLARIVVKPGQEIDSSSIFYEDTDFSAIRKKSDLKTEALDAVSLTLRPATPLSTLTWAVLEGAVIDNDPGIVVTSPRTNFEGRVDVSDRVQLHEQLIVDENTTLSQDLLVEQDLTVQQDATITGSLVVVGASAGRVPLGGVVGVFDYGANVPTTSMEITADGFMLADGGALPNTTKLYAMAVANGKPTVRPNLNNDTFLMGAATSGTTGGANSFSLTTGQLPSHSHTITVDSGGAHSHTFTGGTHGHGDAGHAHLFFDGRYAIAAGSGLGAANTGPGEYLSTETGYAATIPNNVGGTVNSTGSDHSHSATAAPIGTSDAIENRPRFASTIYLVRVS